jgi:lipopolysaccharide/colanic/teichoic acid biosynthesis glycosyltransferase
MNKQPTDLGEMLKYLAGECDSVKEAQIRARLHNPESTESQSLHAIGSIARSAFRLKVLAATALTPPEAPAEVKGSWYVNAKKGIDFALALVLLILTGPIIAVCAMLMKLTSPGPFFLAEVRQGRNLRTFRIFKIRTIKQAPEESSLCGTRWDPRITPFGRFLRTCHLDELPQLLNVLRGEMSLVGPRPEVPEFEAVVAACLGYDVLRREMSLVGPRPDAPKLVNVHDALIVPAYKERYSVKPGITGLAQVALPFVTDLASVRHKLAYDLFYIEHRSLWLDLRILIATPLMIFPWATRLILPTLEIALNEVQMWDPGYADSSEIKPATGAG